MRSKGKFMTIEQNIKYNRKPVFTRSKGKFMTIEQNIKKAIFLAKAHAESWSKN